MHVHNNFWHVNDKPVHFVFSSSVKHHQVNTSYGEGTDVTYMYVKLISKLHLLETPDLSFIATALKEITLHYNAVLIVILIWQYKHVPNSKKLKFNIKDENNTSQPPSWDLIH